MSEQHLNQRKVGADVADTGRGRPRVDRGLVPAMERMAILLMLYVFSIGPMYWSWYAGKYGSGSYYVAAFYEPLWRLAGICRPLAEWLNWYVAFWNL